MTIFIEMWVLLRCTFNVSKKCRNRKILSLVKLLFLSQVRSQSIIICRVDSTSPHGENERECRTKIRPCHQQMLAISHALESQWIRSCYDCRCKYSYDAVRSLSVDCWLRCLQMRSESHFHQIERGKVKPNKRNCFHKGGDEKGRERVIFKNTNWVAKQNVKPNSTTTNRYWHIHLEWCWWHLVS